MIQPSGPSPCEVLIIGEAPGKDEAALGKPFVGESGKELRRMLNQAGFSAGLDENNRIDYANQKVRFTNVFMERPDDNKIDNFCAKKAEVGGTSYTLPPLSQGKYIRPEYLHHLDKLRDEILATNPRLIIALGNTPAWALLRRTGITSIRGNIFPCELAPGYNVLPTFHPANILREWSNRVIAVGDLIKARRYLNDGFTLPRRELWLEPTLAEIREFLDRFIFGDRPNCISVDIETFGETITCVGFAPSRQRAITIPFYDPGKPDRNYWSNLADEMEAWRMVHEVLNSDIPKLGQNFLYDTQYLVRMGLQPRRVLRDTMIRHHSLYPEMPKGLGFMASLYTDEAPWKILRERNKDNFKLDDE